MFWIFEEQDNPKLSSDFESDISNNTYLARLWKLKILQCLYKLIKRFATQPSLRVFSRIFYIGIIDNWAVRILGYSIKFLFPLSSSLFSNSQSNESIILCPKNPPFSRADGGDVMEGQTSTLFHQSSIAKHSMVKQEVKFCSNFTDEKKKNLLPYFPKVIY